MDQGAAPCNVSAGRYHGVSWTPLFVRKERARINPVIRYQGRVQAELNGIFDGYRRS